MEDLAGVFKVHSLQLTEMWKLLLFIALNFRRNEGSNGKVALQFITRTVKLPWQKRIVSTALTGIDWRTCNRVRTVKWKHFQKSHHLNICGFTENIRTTVCGNMHAWDLCFRSWGRAAGVAGELPAPASVSLKWPGLKTMRWASVTWSYLKQRAVVFLLSPSL